eukprot:gene7809-9612_t
MSCDTKIETTTLLECRAKLLIPLFVDIPRENLLRLRREHVVHNLLHRCYIPPTNLVPNSDPFVDDSSLLVIYQSSNNSNSNKIIAVCQVLINPKLVQREVAQTHSDHQFSSSPIQQQQQQQQQQRTINKVVGSIWFLKEELESLSLVQDQVVYVEIVPKYRFNLVDKIYFKNQSNDNIDHQELFDLDWATSGLRPGTPIKRNLFGTLNVNLQQRTGLMISYNYSIEFLDNSNIRSGNNQHQQQQRQEEQLFWRVWRNQLLCKKILKSISSKETEFSNSNNNNNYLLKLKQDWGIITKDTKFIYIKNNNNRNSSNSKDKLKSYDNESTLRIRTLFSMLFNNSGGNSKGILFDRFNISKPSSMLLYGPPSCGKSHIVETISNEIGVKIVKVTISDLLKYQPITKGLILKYQQARQLQEHQQINSILLLDNIDELFPQIDDDGGKREQSLNHLISNCFLDILHQNTSNSIDSQNIIFIVGITNKLKKLNTVIRSTFDEEIKIDPPNLQKRREILNYYFQDFGIDNLDNEKILDEISENCNGLVGGDISILARDAIVKSIQRYKTLDIPFEDIKSIRFEKEDFINEFGPKRKDLGLSKLTSLYIPKVSWDDIGGLEDVKKSLREMVLWEYQNSVAIKRLGVKTPKSILLYGPPGTGKTLLAKAVAFEAKANFISMNISEVVQGEIGESEKILSDIFKKAVSNAPSIIFIDEIQSIFGLKEASGSHGKKLISQLLIEIDAIQENSLDKRVMILAATNLPQAIDKSFLRPGRFDRQLFVGPPDAKERLTILTNIISSMKISIDTDVNLERIASFTHHYTGSDLNALIKKAGLLTIQSNINATSITQDSILKTYWSMKPSISEDQMKFFKDWKEQNMVIKEI